jgi:Domain of unknown function (DUF4397)
MSLWPKVLRPRRLRFAGPRLSLLLGVLVLSSGMLAGAASAAAAAPASSSVGWIRLAHLSPNTPAVDVYLYSYGDPSAMTVLKSVAYGDVSPYMKLATGEYTVAMRGAGAKSGSAPVLSTNVQVKAGGAYTVAGMGPASGLRLEILTDQLTTPPGQALVRVIQASLHENQVTVTAGSKVLAHDLTFSMVSAYGQTTPGTWTVHATGGGEQVTQKVLLGAGTIHTLVILDGTSGLKIDDLEDAAGSAVMPEGGASTGLGGTAPGPAPSPLPWVAAVAAGGLLMLGGAVRLRRVRSLARHAR